MVPEQTLTQTTCYHCGEPTGPTPILSNDKAFCCEGCKWVYELLNEHELCQYYDLSEHPGVQIQAGKNQARFAYLDHPEIQQQLVEFAEGSQRQLTFTLPQIHCSSCVWLLENLYRLRPGILQSRVMFLRKELRIRYDTEQTSLRELVELLSALGYEPDMSLNLMSEEAKKPVDRTFIKQLGVAGFAFGNIMLFSFPEYLGINQAVDGLFFQLFGWLNLLLAIPVLLYSGAVFLKPAWQGLRQGMLTIDVPISMGMLALFGRSVVEITMGYGAGYLDSFAGLVFFLLIGKWFQRKSYDRLSFDRDYRDYFPLATTRIQDNQAESIPVTSAKTGDELLIHDQELIPADAVLLSSEAAIDYAFVTGESTPIVKQKGDMLYAGGRLQGSAIRLAVVKPVSQSYLTSLWNQDDQAPAQKTISSLADRLSKRFTWLILLIALVASTYWGVVAGWQMALNICTAILIVACPCGLALTSPIVLGSAMRWFGRKGVYVKHTGVLEQMAHLDHIVFDKTGTLTLHHGAGNVQLPDISPSLLPYLVNLVRQSSHPVSRQLAAQWPAIPTLPVTYMDTTPGAGISGVVDGVSCRVGTHAFATAAPSKSDLTGTWAKIGSRLIGPFYVQHSYREGLSDMLTELSQSVSLSLISGDTDQEKPYLATIFPPNTPLLFEQHPQEKQAYIHDLKADGKTVMMVGDGLNDAGALMASDIGVAVAESADTFSPACDVIMEGKQLPYLGAYLAWSRQTYRIIKGGLVLSLAYNLVGLSIAITGGLSPLIAAILMPLSSVSVVIYGMSATWLSNRMTKASYDKSQSS